jgi:hypothetical protein
LLLASAGCGRPIEVQNRRAERRVIGIVRTTARVPHAVVDDRPENRLLVEWLRMTDQVREAGNGAER